MPYYRFTCPICQNTVKTYRGPSAPPPRYCSLECYHADKPKQSPAITKSKLHDLYWDQFKTTRQIAKELGCTKRKVQYWLKKHKIPRRRPTETRFPNRQIPSREMLYNHYWLQWLSYQEIADIYNVDVTAVPYWLRKHKIPRRTNWGTRRRGKRIKEPKKAELMELYLNQEFSTRDIGAIYNLSPQTITRRLHKYGIELRESGYNQIRYTCKDGHVVLSGLELRVDNWLFSHALPHDYEPPLPFGGKADFLVGDTYIEVWGIVNRKSYKSRTRKKKRLYQKAGLNLVGLFPKDVLKHLDDKLAPLLSLNDS